MSALGVINGVEGFLHTLAMGVATNGRPQGYAGDSLRTIAAVRKLVSELQKERAARAALEEEVAVLRHALEEAGAYIMHTRDRAAGN